MSRTVKIRVTGRVQGVYFRRFTKNKAQDLGVKGSVQNMEDGRVEIIVHAEADLLEPVQDLRLIVCYKFLIGIQNGLSKRHQP
jgi:acylphosphatase